MNNAQPVTQANIETFKDINEALDRIETIRSNKCQAFLSHKVISGTYDKMNRPITLECDWLVIIGKPQPATQASVMV